MEYITPDYFELVNLSNGVSFLTESGNNKKDENELEGMPG